MAVGDTFEFNAIHAYQLADMCAECKLPQRQVATALQALCNLLVKAADTIDLSSLLIGGEHAFGQGLLSAIKTNCQRFLENAKELPGIEL